MGRIFFMYFFGVENSFLCNNQWSTFTELHGMQPYIHVYTTSIMNNRKQNVSNPSRSYRHYVAHQL